mmetsp:Transcript_101122/g.291084  ORF Transcript_101122/g.291084 Transcript_101122/m.291084 type:complete len:450 (+) Transcript_101122:62-1411(+)
MASRGSTQDWTWLVERLQSGVDSPEEVKSFLAVGGQPNVAISATIGNREARVQPCPRSLELLLKARADPNQIDPNLGSPLLHLAAWAGTPDVVERLLDYRAHIDIPEDDVGTPPLNTALAAGNAPVARLLLERKAGVQWRHKDGASALHVAVAWITDEGGAHRRRAPVGEEPLSVISALLEGGADPSHREGHQGLTPVDAMRDALRSSPWLLDNEIGPEFKKSAENIHTLISAADGAMRSKAKGNKAFNDGSYEAALAAWGEAREILRKHKISGHHVAVLCSNEANCRKKMGDLDGCKVACEAGLAQRCTSPIRKKLEFHLAGCSAAVAKPDGPDSPAANAGDGAPAASTGSTDPDVAAARPKGPAERPAATKLRGGFLKDIGEGSKPMYGPEGSSQGINHSDPVWVPLRGGRHQVPYGKVMPVVYDREEVEDREPDSDDEQPAAETKS